MIRAQFGYLNPDTVAVLLARRCGSLSAQQLGMYLLEEARARGRPIGAGDQVFMYWTYDCPQSDAPRFPPTWDPHLPEITLRGTSVMVPGLKAYLDPMPKPFVDGGYYTKTP